MAILGFSRDTPAEVEQRAAQQDPWVMYLVVRQDVSASADELLVAGAQAAVRCVEEHAERPAWRESFREWSERSFRKVTLRARGTTWGKVAALDGGAGAVRGEDVVRALPPRLRSEAGSLLRGLQVYQPDLAALPPAPSDLLRHPRSMGFVLNPEATMSLGKQIAQIAHAVLLCASSPWASDPRHAEAFAAWRAAGHPGHLEPSSSWSWRRSDPATDGVVVRDAGLTEVAPGSETVIALVPGGRAGSMEIP